MPSKLHYYSQYLCDSLNRSAQEAGDLAPDHPIIQQNLKDLKLLTQMLPKTGRNLQACISL